MGRRKPRHPARQRCIALLMLLCGVHGVSAQQSEDSRLAGAQKAAAKPAWRVLIDDAHPPFSYYDAHGKPAGLTVRILSELLRSVPTPPPIELMPWQRIVLTGTAPNTVIASVARLPERERDYLWIGVLFQESVWLYALRDNSLHLRTLADAAPYRIGTPRNSASHQALLAQGLAESQLDTAGNPIQNLRKLAAGRLDLITMQPAVLAWHSEREGLTGIPFKQVLPVLPPSDFYLAASPGSDPQLIHQLRTALAKLEASGQLRQWRLEVGLKPAKPTRP